MKAGYLLHSASQLTQPGLTDFDIMVVNPAMDSARIAAALKPGAIQLGTFNMTMLSQAGKPLSSFYQSLRATMDPYVLRHSSGAPVMSLEDDEPYFDFSDLEGAMIYAQWMLDNYAGKLYLDDCEGTLPEHKAKDLPDKSIADAFPEWRDLVIDILADAGRDIVINSGGWMCFKANGIANERSHQDRLGRLMTIARYAVQRFRGQAPTMSIDWSGRLEWAGLGIARGIFLPGIE